MSNKENATMPKMKAYFGMILCFVAGFLISSVLFVSQEPVYEKRPISSGGATTSSMSIQNEMLEHIKTEEIRLANDSTDASGWSHLGDLYFDSGQYEKAIIAYERSLSIAPNNTNVMTDLGTMYRATQKPDKALAIYDSVLTLDPKHAQARFNRGVVLFFELEKKAEALNTWKVLVEQIPDFRTPNNDLLADFITEQEKAL